MARLRKTDEGSSMAMQDVFRKQKLGTQNTKKLKERANADKQELSALLKHGTRNANKEYNHRLVETVDLISRALSGPSATTSISTANADERDFPAYRNTAIALNQVYLSSRNILKASTNLIAEYNKLEEMITNFAADGSERDEVNEWQKEIEEAERMLGYGRNKALRDLKRVLGADVEDEDMMDVSGETGDDVENSAGNHYRDLFTYEVGDQLHSALRYAERGVKRMAKGLRKEDTEIWHIGD